MLGPLERRLNTHGDYSLRDFNIIRRYNYTFKYADRLRSSYGPFDNWLSAKEFNVFAWDTL
jgi:hypothetical protein